MRILLSYVLAFGLVPIVGKASLAQSFFVAPQINASLSIGTAQDYATPKVGYGAKIGYQVINRWSIIAGYDTYRFNVDAPVGRLSNIASILSLLDLPDVLPIDMNTQVWNAGFRYAIPYQGIVPFIGLSASTNSLDVEVLGLSVSRRYWGVAPIIGIELPLANRWSLQADTRVQTIFIRGDIPFVDDVVKEHLVFIPIQTGVVFYISK